MKTQLRALIVEDEFITANLLKNYLQELGHNVVALAKNAIETIDYLDNEEIDFVFLDIQIQGSRDGIWLAKKIQKDYHLPFIFVSANSEELTVKKAAKAKPLGFIVKPFKKDEIFATIAVALENFDTKKFNVPKATQADDYTFIKTTNGYKKLRYNDIIYIKSEQKYITVYYTSGKMLLRSGLQDFSDTLPHNMFIRVHRSFLINSDKVDHINPNSIVLGNITVPISASYKEEITTNFSINN
ncbi:hypothetical protein ULMS_11690 [Patiriisocius marinistellae]|uniref:Uncharacterized protein n=1 Tax=Patiriisocius marinistellae TaxID=2494560 RepID=A0A5J4G0U1_9FLAO|nr:response regulator [Patiriisocius marinistellae]GEQ85661.1 hypothetical protein ULMS_11690 [Patiriisocius marinistellae]